MTLQYIILGILTYAPMTGYFLGKVFKKSLGNAWTASLSQIYRELGSLKKKGFVSSAIQAQADRPDKKIYTITEAGIAAFQAWLLDFPETLLAERRDEFMIRIFFGAKLGKEEMIKQFRRFIEQRENFLKGLTGKEAIAEMGKILKADFPKLKAEDQRSMFFMIKRARMSTVTLIQWAKECIEELENS